ncbi:capsular exopolysaccharide synthesis family protein [Paenibacillus cellulosilyticus]|uniref:Capsular exopolysaccharide synthesis family protein n=1 Tax=Paenibacillus cellulosilyticus TaxID=375489 RepID=A0A2V2YZQ4_9BACL|nr:CpsD/CapB family tyrosine-protein kinase [Paenibacillus cellulosilyticus]PWW08488.1 capsular exopolysaccharide synthesis family protein [Paenibacillus cellulosilyticus]QKS48070.1 CpsD/CapB family tyrosine-protein kinase [Paenibacillus cellulosilyticus]
MSRSKNKLVMLTGANREAAEQYRSLRAQIDRAGGQDARLIGVVAPRVGAGTAEMTANLAVAYAQANRRTLLVDGDMQSPLIHKLFGLPNVMGLSSVVEALETAEDTVYHDVVSNLDIMTAGDSLSYTGDAVGSFALQPLFDQWRQRYDKVCLVMPPLLSSADAQLMIAACNGVLLVIRSGQVDEADAARVKRLLALMEVPAYGVALMHG